MRNTLSVFEKRIYSDLRKLSGARAEYSSRNRDRINGLKKGYRRRHGAAIKKKLKAWYARNRTCHIANACLTTKRLRRELSDGSVRQMLTAGTSLRAADIPQSLVNAKRAHLLLIRKLRETK